MTIPFTLFIDTNIFDESNYNFHSASIKAFRQAIKSKSMKLLLPDPIEREIRRHISERSQTAVNSLKNAARTAPFLKQLDGWPLNKKSNIELVVTLEDQVEKELKNFYKTFKLIKLGYDKIDIKEIMNWYDWKEPPFSDKKRKEFPDAFCVAILNQHFKQTKEFIAVISTDNDLKEACNKHKHLLYFPSLSAYAESIQKENQLIKKVHKIIATDDTLIKKAIAEEFPNRIFIIEANWDGEAEDIEVIDFVQIEYHIVGIGDQSFIISFDAEIEYSAYLTYDDLETAIYDGGVAYPIHKIEGEIQTTTSISGTLKVTTKDNNKKISGCESVEYDQDDIVIYDK